MKRYKQFVEDIAGVPTNTTAGIPIYPLISINNKYKEQNRKSQKRVLRYAFITRGATKSYTSS